MTHPVWSEDHAGRRPPERQIRASVSGDSIFVYQAFGHEIADAAVRHQRFAPPFKRERMTWIKPSFTWMMYRSGWAQKSGQERVLRVEISLSGLVWALLHSCPSSFEPRQYEDHEAWRAQLAIRPVRVQWDPERDLRLRPLPWRTVQVGLGGEAVPRYIDDWTRSIEDVTPRVRAAHAAASAGDIEAVLALIPEERPITLGGDVLASVGA